ncbi:phenylacetate--CoA ligase family protein [Selenihalanaerobacter shriftii]|uniref:Phenylacetate-coenzyme A ligase n=1 Tax=Selenihalanaerobacter shriftii TaxID=142842 RepID=A0A1T4KRY3_9FIRM|nr:phenylacetate--CoA ligase [Selenihalanaerobacter shriftii]SJZ45166.1 phenylacetate-CoA ligase [Selenihalanaerobacter shriftii]
MIWDQEYEQMSREELNDLQLSRLKKIVNYVYEEVPFYKQRFDKAGVKPADIKTLDDITKLPFTTKDALRDHYPYGLFAKGMKDIVRLHSSSGTTGKPVVVGYTANDLEVWSDLIARIVTQAGVTDEDIVQICFGYGMFTGGFGLHYGLEEAGATVIPASAGNTKRQIMMMQDFGTTALVSTPSYALYIAEVAKEMGINPHDLGIKIGLFGGEPWTEEMRREIEELWGMRATDNYGLSELIGPGVAGECTESQGLHISEDHFIPEVIDPQTKEPVEPGEKGELVFTTITKEGFPVIRYRTKDISRLILKPCSCGRTTARMEKVSGRTDSMLIIRGVNVFPSQIESVLLEIDEVAPHYQMVIKREGHLDELEVQVELKPDKFTGSFKNLEEIERKISRNLNSVLSLQPEVKLLEPKSLERTQGKSKRVIDKRTEAS